MTNEEKYLLLFREGTIRPGEEGYIPPGDWSDTNLCAVLYGDPVKAACTRDRGHDGDHVAHALEVMKARWRRSPDDVEGAGYSL